MAGTELAGAHLGQHGVEGHLLLIEEHEDGLGGDHSGGVVEQPLVGSVSTAQDCVEDVEAAARANAPVEEAHQVIELVAGIARVGRQELVVALGIDLGVRVVPQVVQVGARLEVNLAFAEGSVDVLEVALVVADLLRGVQAVAQAPAHEDGHAVLHRRWRGLLPLLQLDDHGAGLVGVAVAGDHAVKAPG